MIDVYQKYLQDETGMDIEKEFRFHPVRRFRFDYAIPSLKIAIEIDGGVFSNGRHTRGSGFIKDMEKFNIAASMGWRVLKFTPQNKFDRQSVEFIKQAIINK